MQNVESIALKLVRENFKDKTFDFVKEVCERVLSITDNKVIDSELITEFEATLKRRQELRQLLPYHS